MSQVVDVLIGQRAGAFVGNGVCFSFSWWIFNTLVRPPPQFFSLSGNAAMLRVTKGLHPHQTRFWI